MKSNKINIDIEALLERCGNDWILIEELSELLNNDLEYLENEANTYLQLEDFSKLASFAHKLKSSVGTLGFVDIQKKLNSLESKLKNNNKKIDYNKEFFNIFISLKNHIKELQNLIKNNKNGNF